MSPEVFKTLGDQARRICDIAGDMARAVRRERDRQPASLSARCDNLEAERVHLANRNMELETEVNQLIAERNKERERLSSLATNLEICRADKHSIGNRYVALKEEHDKILKELAAYKEENSKLTNQLEKYRSDRRRLFDTADVNEKRLRNLMAAVKAAIEQDKA